MQARLYLPVTGRTPPSRTEALGLISALPERPRNANRHLGRTDRHRQRRPLGQTLHEPPPRLRSSAPRMGILAGVNQRHHAIANQQHRRKVLYPLRIRKSHVCWTAATRTLLPGALYQRPDRLREPPA